MLTKNLPVIDGLQMLRGLAATLVVLFHLYSAAVSEGFSPGLLSWFSQGEAGVDIFFVLSGFVIFHACRGRENSGAGRFLQQRFWRIVPPYWVVLMLTLLAMVALGVMTGSWDDFPGMETIAISALLLPVPNQVMSVAWTLTLEGIFYLLFAATFFRFGVRGALAALLGWALLTQALKFWTGFFSPAFGIIFYSGVIEFLYGGLIALAFGAGWRRGAGWCVALGSVGMALVISGVVPFQWEREWVAGLPAAALVYGMAAGGWKMPRWAMLWGDSSYILYLLHLLIFSVVGTVLRKAGIEPYGSLAPMLGMAAMAIAVSMLATVWIEAPYRRWTRSRVKSGIVG